MCLEKSTPIRNGEKNADEVLQKTLKVVNKPYKDKYVPGINIQGNYLRVYGFDTGDRVEVLVSENQISISKIIDKTNGLD